MEDLLGRRTLLFVGFGGVLKVTFSLFLSSSGELERSDELSRLSLGFSGGTDDLRNFLPFTLVFSFKTVGSFCDGDDELLDGKFIVASKLLALSEF